MLTETFAVTESPLAIDDLLSSNVPIARFAVFATARS